MADIIVNPGNFTSAYSSAVTGDRLLFAGVSTLYLVLAIPLEEAGLAAQFGESYAAYRRAVRWRLIPYLH